MIRNNKIIGNYKLMNEIGRGNFGIVYKAITIVEPIKICAVKVIPKSIISSKTIKELLKNEITIMKRINHENIMPLYDYYESENNHYLVMKYCESGDLKNFIINNKNKEYLEEDETISILKQILEAFKTLKIHNVIHRDFKLENIFVNNDKILIGDFGLAKIGYKMTQTKLGSSITMAPEVLEGNDNKYDSKADIWSIGVVVYQIIYGDIPFFGFDDFDLLKSIKEKCENFEFPNNIKISKNLKNLFLQIFKVNPEERIGWNEFFSHPLIKNDEEDKKHSKCSNTSNNEYEDILYKYQSGIETVGNSYICDHNPLIDINLIISENNLRFTHEKNISIFIMRTTKLIKSLMKCINDNTINCYLYIISILLMKKCIVLLRLNVKNLEEKKNIFNLSYYNEFCKSQLYMSSLKILKNDLSMYDNYFEYLLSFKDSLQLSDLYVDLINILCKEDYIKLQRLDNLILEYKEILIKDINNICKNLKKEKLKAMLYLILIYIYHSVKCQYYFPFINDGIIFKWYDYYKKYEEMNFKNLVKEQK